MEFFLILKEPKMHFTEKKRLEKRTIINLLLVKKRRLKKRSIMGPSLSGKKGLKKRSIGNRSS